MDKVSGESRGTAVIYFSRTGTSEGVAKKIAAGLGVPVYGLDDHMNWKGIFGFIKGGYYASKDKQVFYDLFDGKTRAQVSDFHPEACQQLIVVSPLWAGGTAPAIRALMKDLGEAGKGKVHLVITSNGSTASLRSGYASVTDIVKTQKDGDGKISDLIGRLKA